MATHFSVPVERSAVRTGRECVATPPLLGPGDAKHALQARVYVCESERESEEVREREREREQSEREKESGHKPNVSDCAFEAQPYTRNLCQLGYEPQPRTPKRVVCERTRDPSRTATPAGGLHL